MASKAVLQSGISWQTCRGRNGVDPPARLADDLAAEATNWTFANAGLGGSRPGSTRLPLSNGFGFSGINAIGGLRIWGFPSVVPNARHLYAFTRDASPKFAEWDGTLNGLSSGAPGDACSDPIHVQFVPFNNKLYVAYQSSGVNRLHYVDAGHTDILTLRRSGLKAPAAPTVANTGGGAYAATLRYYRIQWRNVFSGADVARSNLGTSVSFTPSGGGTAARVTQPAVPVSPEIITHWVVYVSLDDALYYKLSGEIAIATTTYDDSTVTTSYQTGEAAPEEGAFTPWPSVKYLLSTGERLLGWDVWESAAGDAMTPVKGRVYFSPVVNTTDTNDEERVSNSLTIKGYIDIGPANDGDARALAGPLNDQIFCFKNRGVWALSPTGNAEVPYRRTRLNAVLGALNQWSTFTGEDEYGRPCIYFLDEQRGPYRYGDSGFQWLGYEVLDKFRTLNPNAANQVAHGLYNKAAGLALFWIATGTSDDPDTVLAFHVKQGQASADSEVRGGWAIWTGRIAQARCSFADGYTYSGGKNTDYLPLLGYADNYLIRALDSSAFTDDDSSAFTSSLTSRAFPLLPLNLRKQIGKAYVQAKALASGLIKLTFTRNYGEETRSPTAVSIAASGSETRVLQKFEDAALEQANTIQVTLDNSSANTVGSYVLDEFVATVELTSEER
jgi:hypothetical protein